MTKRGKCGAPWRTAVLGLIWLFSSLIVLVGEAPAADGETILLAGGYWRVFTMRAPGVVPLELLREVRPSAEAAQVIDRGWMRSPPPPLTWTDPDFDDADWPRLEGPFSGGYVGWANQYHRQGRALICLRGKFKVNNPAGIRSMVVTARYQGGVVIYLNGNEVFRGHLPKGKVEPDTLAAPYPRDPYVDAKGKVLPEPYHVRTRLKSGEAGLAERLAMRTSRQTGSPALPLAALRQGVNVLAVEVHRSGFRPEIGLADKKRGAWPHIGLSSLVLTATAAPGAIEPNIARPKGFQAWNQDPNRIFGPGEYGDPNEPLRAIRLVGPRNGHYSGQVVVGSTRAIEGLKAEVTELRASDGRSAVPAANVRVRFPRPTGLGIAVRGPGYRAPAFAILADEPPARLEPVALGTNRRERVALGLPAAMAPAAVQPVYVTVHVPKNVAAGEYRGTLTITARGVPETKASIVLTVVDWTLPETRDLRPVVAIYQSPESLAAKYSVPMWSDEHMARMERSWRLMGYLGNNLLVVPLVNRTQFGNDECLIPWVKGDGGTYTYDFNAYDKLVRLAQQHCDIGIVSYQINLAVGWGAAKPDKPTYVTVVDPRTGRREAMKLPAYGTAESMRLWKPFIKALRPRHKTLGLGKDVQIVLGIAQDGGIHKALIEQFKALFPEAKWHYGAHNRPYGWRREVYGFSEYLYVGAIPAPTKARRYGWRNEPLTLMSQRARDNRQTPLVIRTMVERALILGDNGPGRMCLDYWPVPGSGRGNHGNSLFSRWPDSSASQRTPHLRLLTLPGKDGALATIKTEAFREGLQEAEARIVIEEALLTKKVTGDLAERCQRLLDARVAPCQAGHSQPYSNRRTAWIASGGGWQRLSEHLYRLAAEVAALRR